MSFFFFSKLYSHEFGCHYKGGDGFLLIGISERSRERFFDNFHVKCHRGYMLGGPGSKAIRVINEQQILVLSHSCEVLDPKFWPN